MAALALAPIGRADAADQRTQFGGTIVAGVCTVTGSLTRAGSFNFDEDLLIESGATIKVSPAASGLDFTVNGNFTMEAGSLIDGTLLASGHGADITVDATGDIKMLGGANGPKIIAPEQVRAALPPRQAGQLGGVRRDLGG